MSLFDHRDRQKARRYARAVNQVDEFHQLLVETAHYLIQMYFNNDESEMRQAKWSNMGVWIQVAARGWTAFCEEMLDSRCLLPDELLVLTTPVELAEYTWCHPGFNIFLDEAFTFVMGPQVTTVTESILNDLEEMWQSSMYD